MQDLHVTLSFWNCKAVKAEDIVAWARVLRRYDIVLLSHRTLEPLPEEKWMETFQRELEDEGPLIKSSVRHSVAFKDWGEAFSAGFDFAEYRKGGNKLEIGGFLLLGWGGWDHRLLMEPFAQRLLAVARELYPLARPTYGEIDGGWGEWESKDVRDLRLKHVSWVNFFGPAYVEKYGRDFLLGLPGYKTELLPDGGVFHQLSPTFVAPSEQEAKRLRREVIAYCAEHGLKVTCKAPFVIPGLTAQRVSAKAQVPDAEFEAYLKHILSITLVLEDGTRLKHIYIPWGDLTADQRRMAVEAIRRAAVEEVKRSGGRRVRFEFNEIPDELDQALAGLAGRDNPAFEWVEVPVEEQGPP